LRKKGKGRGYNPRLKGNKWEIKDEELNAELKSGAVLLAYSSNDPTEPTVDTSISVDGDSNVFADSDPIPGLDVKLGQNK
jgi:hypothetical protein